MDIWAHCMVKNEARWLWYSVTSVIDHVDKVLLWDTGSSDGSQEIELELERKYSGKIILNNKKMESINDFTKLRQEMLKETSSDWFLMLDADEVWYDASVVKVVNSINENNAESIIVPTINLVGDIYHYQDKTSGGYNFGNLKGHYNLRAINMQIPGLHSQGVHGVWGWADGENKMIQDRNTYKFIDAPYLHATSVVRSDNDRDVIKRVKKLKYEIGIEFPLDFYYPEAFFQDRPNFVEGPWKPMSKGFKFRAFFETPLRKIKRSLVKGRVGY